MKKIGTVTLMTIALWICVPAVQAQKVRFTSAYTSLGRGCKTIGEKEAERTGSDPAFLCPGVGRLQIYISNAAMAASLSVQKRGSEDPIVSFMSECADYGQKAEWRLANGKPFAVIIRMAKYPDDNMSSGQPCSKKLGTDLVIKGLKGYEGIDQTVDGAEPDANAKARSIADKLYSTRDVKK